MIDAPLIAGWENFYVIVGSSAGGQTGLPFVIITLVGEAQGVRPMGFKAFVTPTIVHFGVVLALAAYLSMPNHGPMSLSLGFGLAGLGGLIYGGAIAANMKGQSSNYVPVPEDWAWNVLLPTLAYGALLVLAALVWLWPARSLYGVGAVSVFLLFIGIHNAWDIAVRMTAYKHREKQ